MVKWRDCKLGDLLEVKHGFAFLGEHFGSTGTHVVLTPGNFLEEGGFKERADKAKWYRGPIPEDYVLNEGDLIVAMTEQAEGLLGSSAIIPRSGVYLHNQRLGLVRIRDLEQADQHFIYYLFNTKPVRQQIRGSASGTKIRHTAPSRIADVKVSVPPLPIQRRIAGILSAYDELIENSQQRIKILESMARGLYREWLVHFRFPGHESVPRVPSPLGEIPKGWEVKTFGDLYNTSSGGTPSRKRPEYFEGGSIDWVKSQELLDKFILCTEERITPDAIANSSAKVFPPNTVLVALYGATIGMLAIIAREAATNQACCAVLPKSSAYGREFAFLTLLTNRERIIGLRLGAAQQNISQVLLRNFECIKPPTAIATQFAEHVSPLFDGILNLQLHIQNLRRTRDLLLPRLLSGQIKLD